MRSSTASAIVTAALLLGSCSTGGSQQDDPPTAPGAADPSPLPAVTTGPLEVGDANSVVSVVLDDFTLVSDKDIVPSGTVTFEVDVAEDAEAPHEFSVYRTDLPADELPTPNVQVNPNDPRVELIGHLGVLTRPENLETQLSPGAYVLLCNQANHYKRGMFAGLRVE